MDPSVAEVLRLIGDGATGQILMALGERALRTGQLAERIEDCSSRSIYRYAGKLHRHGLVDRFEEAGIPSTVILSLSTPSGRNLYRLLQTFAVTPLARLPAEGRYFQSWTPLSLLGELWKTGFIEELSRGSRSLTELAQSVPEMTYHQVIRRMELFIANGLLMRVPHGKLKHYGVTDHGRRRMALVTGIGRWRRRHLRDGAPGLTVGEMATVLRTVLPLILLPGYAGMSIDFGVSGEIDENGLRATEMLQGTVDDAGKMHCDQAAQPAVNGSAGGTLNTWFAALLDGNRGRMQVGGDLSLVNVCLTQLHEVLWEGSRSTAATPR